MFVVARVTGYPDVATLPLSATPFGSEPKAGSVALPEFSRAPVADAFAAGRAAISRAGFSPGAGGDFRPKTAAVGMTIMLHTTTAVRGLMLRLVSMATFAANPEMKPA